MTLDRLYRIEQELASMTSSRRLEERRRRSVPLWDELHAWLRLERTRVPDGGGIAAAID
ncbi:transposase [Ramlibacter sp.]|uniref:IS66 family transposase n=1 Tax=Ramlibacter sp. TaxID=1917967 RepID=UPI00345D073B